MVLTKVLALLLISSGVIALGYQILSNKKSKLEPDQPAPPSAMVQAASPSAELTAPFQEPPIVGAWLLDTGVLWKVALVSMVIAAALFAYLRPDERFRETPSRYRSLSKGPSNTRLIDPGPEKAYFDRFEESGPLIDEEESDVLQRSHRKSFRLADDERQDMLKRVEDKLYAELYPQVLNDLESRFAASAFSKGSSEQLFELLDACRERLEGEVDALTKRGTLNLIVGTVLSGLVLVVLGEMSYSAVTEKPPETWAAAGTSYLPRLSLAVFIQIFAFFFLKIYRATLSEIKYFHNEITTVDMTCAAFTDGLRIGDKKVQGDVVRAVAAIDKNERLRANPRHAAENDDSDILTLLASFTEALSKLKK